MKIEINKEKEALYNTKIIQIAIEAKRLASSSSHEIKYPDAIFIPLADISKGHGWNADMARDFKNVIRDTYKESIPNNMFGLDRRTELIHFTISEEGMLKFLKNERKKYPNMYHGNILDIKENYQVFISGIKQEIPFSALYDKIREITSNAPIALKIFREKGEATAILRSLNQMKKIIASDFQMIVNGKKCNLSATPSFKPIVKKGLEIIHITEVDQDDTAAWYEKILKDELGVEPWLLYEDRSQDTGRLYHIKIFTDVIGGNKIWNSKKPLYNSNLKLVKLLEPTKINA
jgi:hypothetical protein